MARQSSTTDGETGRIVPGQLLSVERAQADLRLAYQGWRRLRRAGLESCIKTVAGRGFILSDDLIECFKRLPGRETKQ